MSSYGRIAEVPQHHSKLQHLASTMNSRCTVLLFQFRPSVVVLLILSARSRSPSPHPRSCRTISAGNPRELSRTMRLHLLEEHCLAAGGYLVRPMENRHCREHLDHLAM